MMTNVPFVRMWLLVVLIGSAWDAQAMDQGQEIPRLIEQLGDESPHVRQAATDKLIEIGEPVLPAVRKAAESDDPEVNQRARAILGIVEMKSRLCLSDKLLRSMPDIYRQLAEGTSGADVYRVFAEVTRVDWESKRKKPLHAFDPADAGKLAGLMAARGFSEMRGDEKRTFLERCGGEVCFPDGWNFSSSDLHLPATAPHLVPLLKDGDAKVREAATGALVNLGAKEYAKDIVPLLKDGDVEVRRVVASALGSLGVKEVAHDLVPLLKDGDEYVRYATAEALVDLAAREHAPDLVPLLKDEVAMVRRVTACALGSLGAKEHAPALVPLLKDGDKVVRWTAAWALGNLGAKEHAPDLVPLLKDGDGDVRAAAGIALVELGKVDIVTAAPEVVEQIKQVAEDNGNYPDETQARAARALEKLGIKQEEPKK